MTRGLSEELPDCLPSSSLDLGPAACVFSASPMSGEPSPMENDDPSCAKKARVEAPPGFRVKQEVLEGVEKEDDASGGPAPVPAVVAAAAAARSELVVKIDRDMLHCPICTLPLKPPIFQCAVGHMACGSCHGQLPTKQCLSCGGGGGGGGGGSPYARCPAMDAFVAKAVVPCPHQAYGCRASVAYHQAADHGAACPQVPCACALPGCAFVGPPSALLAHLAAAPHSWPVDEVRYGETLRLRVLEHQARRLLAAEDGGGGQRALFVLAVGDRGARVVPVTVACVRPRGAAAAGPQYTCKMWATGCKAPATGKVESVLVDMEVPSAAAAAADGDGEEFATLLPVPRSMLRGVSRQMHLSIRIDRVSC